MKEMGRLLVIMVASLLAISGANARVLLLPDVTGDGAAFDEFGRYVELSGPWLMVGVPADDAGGQDTGAIYAFSVANASVPFQIIRMVPPVAQIGFGTRISLHGLRMAVESSLGIHIYQYNGSSWVSLTLVPKPGPEDSCGSFSHPEISGDWLFVGCLGQAHDRMHLYKFNGSGFDRISVLDPPQGRSGIGFGYSADIAGSYAVVAARGWMNSSQIRVGAAYVYELQQGDIWSNIGQLTASDGQEFDSFGAEVRICGSHVVVSASTDDTIHGVDSGSVYRFNLASGNQSSSTKYSGDVRPGGNFGHSVACDNERLAVGALFDRVGAGSGSTGTVTVMALAPVFGVQSFKIAPEWLNSGPELVGDFFGADVALQSDFLAVGLPYRSIEVPFQEKAGAVYVDKELWLLFRDGFE